MTGSISDVFTADDVTAATRLALDTLSPVSDDAWDVPAHLSDWSCWEVVEHLTTVLFFFATQLGPQKPPLDELQPFSWKERREGGPAHLAYVRRETGTRGALRSLESCGAVLAAVVRTTPEDRRARHPFGNTGPEGFAALAVAEIVVHTHDVAVALGLPFTPPQDLMARAVRRLVRDAPDGEEPWATMLWATGRGELPGRERLSEWRWYSAPEGE